MACRSPVDDECDRLDTITKLDEVTAMLCELCETCDMETTKLIDGCNLNIRQWWEQHKKDDVKRNQQELKSALDELERLENSNRNNNKAIHDLNRKIGQIRAEKEKILKR